MSVEALQPSPESRTSEEDIVATEFAIESLARVRILLAQQKEQLRREKQAEVPNTGIVRHTKMRIEELKQAEDDSLTFLQGSDPQLYQELKDIK